MEKSTISTKKSKENDGVFIGKRNNRQTISYRDKKGRFISWTYLDKMPFGEKVKGKRLKKSDILLNANEYYKEKQTFRRTKPTRSRPSEPIFERKSILSPLTNTEEVVTDIPSKLSERDKPIILPKPSSKIVQYVVSGEYKGQRIYGRSDKLGTGDAKTPKEAKKQAWSNFVAKIGGQYTGTLKSDEAEGESFIKSDDGQNQVKNIREGWVSYNFAESKK